MTGRYLYLAWLCLVISGCFNGNNTQLNELYNDGDKQADSLLAGAQHIEFLYQQQRGGVKVSSAGRIVKLFENEQPEEQLILVRLNNGRKLLIKHNIKKAPVIPHLTVGEMLTFSGVYRWNNKGGIVQSTYQQIDNPQRSGWIKYQQVTYQ